jgi:hypothetical protein
LKPADIPVELDQVASDYGHDYSVNVRFCADVKNCEPHMNVFNPMQTTPYDPYYGYEPFPIRVVPGPVEARYCTALGPDLIEGGLVGALSSPSSFI